MRLPPTAHANRPWRIHDIADDFTVEDVWALPTPGGPDDFPWLVRQFAEGVSGGVTGDTAISRALFTIRWKLGALLGWDRPDTGVGGRLPSLYDRLPADLRSGSRGPDLGTSPFRSVYQLENEWAAEMGNTTVHAVMHLGWVPDGTGGYRGQMAVLVKPNGLLGALYMAGIKPFRYLGVYPALMRAIGREWQANTVAEASHGKGVAVHTIFEKIAGYYDRMNLVMTLGRHARWCREVATRAAPPAGGQLLDLATGTGAIALAAAQMYPTVAVTGADFSEAMLARARIKAEAGAVRWQQADATRLPFDDESFDAVTEGYLLRNIEDLPGVLREQHRVLVPGGRIVILETCPPSGPLKPILEWGMRTIIPLLGQTIARDRSSYTYLESSTLAFTSPQHVANVLCEMSFQNIGWSKKFLGTNVILWADKPR
ncbi:ubiquinone/menaquinone biosynthesis methyltransferase [Nocardia sp. NPDC059091]|uniref:ubiquinone/menaquinone biosynthesis methyltransferase n=1 Tax=unclassified Nocardia TaxID=2637762 RepID=UPI00368F13A0